METNEENHVSNLRTNRSLLLILFLELVAIFLILNKDDRIIFQDYILIIAILIIPMSAVFIYKYSVLKIDASGLEKRSFKTRVSFKWQEIKRADVEIHTNFFPNTHRHAIKLKSGNKELIILLTDYSRKKVKILCEAIVSTCPDANISDKIRNMAEGKFPWYIFQLLNIR